MSIARPNALIFVLFSHFLSRSLVCLHFSFELRRERMERSGLRILNLRNPPVNLIRFRSRTNIGQTVRRREASPLCARRNCSTSLENEDLNSFGNGSLNSVNEASCPKILQVVLVSPQIPGNTGSIARTCAASAVGLHLVGPLGYKIEDSKLKRAGLDYWPYVVVKIHKSWAEFRDYFKQQPGEKRLLAFSKRGTSIHSDFSYKKGDWLVFGSETKGLPNEALEDCSGNAIGAGSLLRIPMVDTYVRCLNLSVSVGVALYEAARQLNYQQLEAESVRAATEKLFFREDIYG
ncbi:hypothetical protein LUZ60_003364 [Juncus effusus]|nr:hypothetical protein LUZ60_003364 [Juncus effusus]